MSRLLYDAILVLEEKDSFCPDVVKGSRLMCVLVPEGRHEEFLHSPGFRIWEHCTDHFFFYSQKMDFPFALEKR